MATLRLSICPPAHEPHIQDGAQITQLYISWSLNVSRCELGCTSHGDYNQSGPCLLGSWGCSYRIILDGRSEVSGAGELGGKRQTCEQKSAPFSHVLRYLMWSADHVPKLWDPVESKSPAPLTNGSTRPSHYCKVKPFSSSHGNSMAQYLV